MPLESRSLGLLFALSLAACGGSSSGAAAPTDSTSTTGTGDEAPAAAECPSGQVLVAGSCEVACEIDDDCPEGRVCLADGDERAIEDDGTIGPLLEVVHYCGLDE